jgi:hypothetical protein
MTDDGWAVPGLHPSSFSLIGPPIVLAAPLRLSGPPGARGRIANRAQDGYIIRGISVLSGTPGVLWVTAFRSTAQRILRT